MITDVCVPISRLAECLTETRRDADEHGFPFHRAVGTLYRGWALAGSGQTGQGIALLEAGLVDTVEPAVVPGKPDDSELVRRVFSTDETEVMPPPSTRNPLTERQKQVLKRWVAGGAEYAIHWAFVPPRQTPLPKVRQADWPRNPISGAASSAAARPAIRGVTPGLVFMMGAQRAV